MKNSSLNKLFDLVAKQPRRRLVVANGTDQHSLEAISKAVHEGLVTVMVTGNENEIIRNCRLKGILVDSCEIVHCENDDEAVAKAVQIARNGQADIIMKGLISTDQFMRAILNKENGLLPENTLLSHVALIKIPTYRKPLFVGDVAIIPNPTLEQKKQITNNLILVAKYFGIEIPKVAFLAATEKIIAKMTACTDAVQLKQMWENGEFPNTICDGPMALDLAVDKKSADIKGFVSPVAGDADCLLFPNIESGNVFYKAVSKFCEPDIAAIVMGTSVPTVLSSRSDSIQTKLYSIALAALIG